MLRSRLFAIIFLLGVFNWTGAEAQAAAEDEVTLTEAKLEVFIKEELFGPAVETEYHVKKNEKSYRIHFPKDKQPEGLYTGLRVNLKGKKIDENVLAVEPSASTFEITGGELLTGAGGIRQALVLRISSTTAVSAATDTQLISVMNAVDSWYQQSSFQTLSMKNDRENDGKPDIYTVSIPSASAGVGESSAFSFCNSAKQAASTSFGLTPSLWNHVICLLPPDMNYGWFGQAYINGADIVINGNYAGGYPGGYTHEIGHNLGMHHANTPGTEYGESACVMGGNAGTGRRDFNGPHKHQMAWLPAASASEGTYVINAVEAQAAERVSPNTVLRLRDAAANEDLYISYRAPLGTFAAGLNSPYKTSIHSFSGGAVQTILLANLSDGQSFSRNGITVTQTAHDNLSAAVAIGAVCTARAPTITLSPSTTATNVASTAHFTVTVANNDINCTGPATFSLTAAAPGLDWAAVPDSSAITVLPGQSSATSLELTPPPALTAGSYAFSIAAAAPGRSAAAAAGHYLFDNIAPSSVALSATAGKKNQIVLKWTAASDGLSGVSGYRLFRNGALLASTTALQYTDSPGSGTFSYQAVAFDRAGNQSAASNNVVMTAGSTGRRK